MEESECTKFGTLNEKSTLYLKNKIIIQNFTILYKFVQEYKK